MDLLAHVMYGATICSRSGLAGGRKGAGARWRHDSTVWVTAFFSLLPDAVSMWIPFALYLVGGPKGIFFHHYDGNWMVVYRFMHSMLPALLVTCMLYFVRRRWALASLAWPVHILCDALTHGAGRWKTMFFYPASTWGMEGMRFWEHFWVMPAYWLVILALILFIRVRRKSV